jgi:hypothetical protein
MFLDAEVNFSRIFLVVLHFLLVEISYQIPICRNMWWIQNRIFVMASKTQYLTN